MQSQTSAAENESKRDHLHKCENGWNVRDLQRDRITMNGMNCEFLSNVPAKFKRTLDKMAQKGGCTVVNRGRSLITAFRVDSFTRNLAE